MRACPQDVDFVSTWSRLLKFVWTYRRRLGLSLGFGVAAAALWAVQLLLTFPITVMFGEHGTLGNYIRHEAAETSKIIDRRSADLQQLELELDGLPENGLRRRQGERVRVIDSLRRKRVELNVYTTKLWVFTWVEAKICRNLPEDPFRLFAALFAGILVVILAKGICGYSQDLLAGSAAEAIVIDMRQELFRRAMKLDPQSLARDGTPVWLSELTYTLQGLANGLTEMGGRIIREPLKAVACLIALFYLNWQLTLVFLLFMPVLGLLFHWLGQRLKRAANRAIESMSRLYKRMEETFHNSKAVIAFDGAGVHRRSFYRENEIYYRQAMKLVQIDAMSGPISEMLVMLAATAVLLPAAYLVLRETTTIWGIPLASSPPDFPDFALCYVLLAGILEPMRKFSKFYTTIRNATTVAERVFQRMDTASLIAAPAKAQLLPTFHQQIEFRDVRFRYAFDNAERGVVLNNLNLTIHAGETVAVVGPNGSGKSTLVNLLPRFYDPDGGSVLLDGINLKDVRLRDLREQITLVSQETLLFDDTIMANIRYGRPDASDTDVLAAARRAHVMSMAESLPEGLQTMVGEGGRQLSGGQRQRIALARAILRDSRILILDEPTSAIDAESELLIQTSLKEVVQDRTTLLITHCLTPTLLSLLTRIVVLDQGRVVATGRHDQLLSTCPLYQRLWSSQTQRAVA